MGTRAYAKKVYANPLKPQICSHTALGCLIVVYDYTTATQENAGVLFVGATPELWINNFKVLTEEELP
jgi:hypothetical protein